MSKASCRYFKLIIEIIRSISLTHFHIYVTTLLWLFAKNVNYRITLLIKAANNFNVLDLDFIKNE